MVVYSLFFFFTSIRNTFSLSGWRFSLLCLLHPLPLSLDPTPNNHIDKICSMMICPNLVFQVFQHCTHHHSIWVHPSCHFSSSSSVSFCLSQHLGLFPESKVFIWCVQNSIIWAWLIYASSKNSGLICSIVHWLGFFGCPWYSKASSPITTFKGINTLLSCFFKVNFHFCRVSWEIPWLTQIWSL